MITGAGFVLASAVTPSMSARVGLRATMIICLVASAVFQVMPGAIYTWATQMVAAFLLGLTAQGIKIGVDTLVQAHVADEFKGRVFVLYDMIFNVALVAAVGDRCRDPAGERQVCDDPDHHGRLLSADQCWGSRSSVAASA